MNRFLIFASGDSKSKFLALLFMLIGLAVLAGPAHAAASFDVPFINEIGCKVVQWMKGPLAILVFILVVVATLLIGMIAKMDWGKLIAVTVLFGILTGIGGILANSSSFQSFVGLSSCLQ
jgi:type IV secretory pathway VirB2 component (pilin)